MKIRIPQSLSSNQIGELCQCYFKFTRKNFTLNSTFYNIRIIINAIIYIITTIVIIIIISNIHFKSLPTNIDKLLLHLKNKILVYRRYVLSKISWRLNVADLPIAWMKQTLENMISQFIRSWLEITISNVIQKTGLGLILVYDRMSIHLQKQTEIFQKRRHCRNLWSNKREQYHIWSIQINKRGYSWYM